jgi:hypothetical protein
MVDQVKISIAAFQGGNNYINKIVKVCENDAILLKEDEFIKLTLNEITSNESFA